MVSTEWTFHEIFLPRKYSLPTHHILLGNQVNQIFRYS